MFDISGYKIGVFVFSCLHRDFVENTVLWIWKINVNRLF